MSPELSTPSASNRVARESHQMSPHRWGKAGYVALFIVLALTAVQCARLGMSGLFVQTAQAELDRWTSESRKMGKAEIRHVAKYFSNSLLYVSDNPWALEGLGALELARMRVSTNPREALAVTRSASVRFRQALLQRPSSPYLWANLALTKLYLDEIDDELRAALRHADELGPWEPTVQQTVLFVGLAAWPDLNPGLRQALTQTIERGALHDAQKMYQIAKSYTRFDLVCTIEKYRLIAGPDCGKSAQASGQASR